MTIYSYLPGSRVDYWVLTDYLTWNVQQELYTTVVNGGRSCNIEDLEKLFSLEFLQMMFRVTGQLQACHLSEEERNVLKGIAVLARGE